MIVTVQTPGGRGQVVGFAVAGMTTATRESQYVLVAIEKESLQVFDPRDCKVLSVESEALPEDEGRAWQELEALFEQEAPADCGAYTAHFGCVWCAAGDAIQRHKQGVATRLREDRHRAEPEEA